MTQSILDALPRLYPRKDSLLDQLRDLCLVANRLGMRDAADVVNETINKIAKQNN